MDIDERHTCRLCCCTQSHQINIFNDSESNRINVAEIINEHFGEVNDSDALPKTVCIDCWNTTENFHRFHRFVQSAQANFIDSLLKLEFESEVGSCDESNEIEDIIKNATGSLIQHVDLNDVALAEVKCEALDEVEESSNLIETNNRFLMKEPKLILFDIVNGVAAERNPLIDVEHSLENDLVNDEKYSFNKADSPKKSLAKSDAPGIANSNEIHKKIVQNFDCSCDVCQIDLKSLDQAKIHYKKEHDIDEGYIKCCGLKLKHRLRVNDHIRWHINPDIFKCIQCGRVMKTKMSLSAHLSDHRYSYRKFICDLCGKSFTKKQILQAHLEAHVLVCKSCSTRCLTKQKLEAHERKWHNADIAPRIEKQLDTLKKAQMTLSTSEYEEIKSKNFDMTCDVCTEGLKSLQQAQFHYMHEHQMRSGYVKCCGIKFMKNKSIKSHIYWHKNPEIFKCQICGKIEKTDDRLRIHLALHKTKLNPKRYICAECGRGFYQKRLLARHMKAVHGIHELETDPNMRSDTRNNQYLNATQKFDTICDICYADLNSLHHAKLHYLDVHGILDGYVKCCDIKFTELYQLNDHLQFHSNPDIFKCKICGKTFMRTATLNNHLNRHKSLANKQYVCKKCEKPFETSHRLKKHEKTHEKKEANISCGHCNRRFATETLQKEHEQRIHNKGDDREQTTAILCEFCAKPFNTQKNVLNHIRKMHAKNTKPRERLQCTVCSTWIATRYLLAAHMLRHTSEPVNCTQCDKISPNQQALMLHIRNVHTERIHKCHLCDKSFKAAVALKDHVATHTGEKLYKCLYCPESFIWRPNCYSHQKKAHPDEWNQSQTKKKTVAKV